jgi:hypothetical protein
LLSNGMRTQEKQQANQHQSLPRQGIRAHTKSPFNFAIQHTLIGMRALCFPKSTRPLLISH